MAGVMLTGSVSRTLLSVSGAILIRGTNRCYRTAIRRTAAALTSGGAAFLLGLPALSCLGYEAYRRVQSSAVVRALQKEEVLEQADYLYSCAETEKLYQLLLQYKDSDDAEFLWRLARASRDVSLLPNMEAERKKQLTYEAFEYAKKALERDNKCFAAHKWYAVCLSDVGDWEGTKVKIGNSVIIRAHLELLQEHLKVQYTSREVIYFGGINCTRQCCCISPCCHPNGKTCRCTLLWNFEQMANSVPSKTSPHHHSSSSALHRVNPTCRPHLFTLSVYHKDAAVGTKNFKTHHTVASEQLMARCACCLSSSAASF
ncbi:regulator of microtubule dynamics protein 1 isoform X1 [Chaetodon auriga]|uniref:regulator of microtubule dynamics protein 1 isoform X1 n=1 Tax=Chaetodon auriga TaxID=39042 RepID=UPI004032E61A